MHQHKITSIDLSEGVVRCQTCDWTQPVKIIVNGEHANTEPAPAPTSARPEWANAPAVMAFVKGRVGDPQVFSRENEAGTQWVRDTKVYRWDELIAVVPLYPKEDA